MTKDSKMKVTVQPKKTTIDVIIRDEDGALTAHLTGAEAMTLGEYLLAQGKRLK